MSENFTVDDILRYLTSTRFIVSIITIAAAVLLWFVIHSIFKKVEKKIGDAETDPKKFVFITYTSRILKLLLIVLTLLTVLQINGINVGSLLAGLGIVSAISGLALQDILKDVIMGVRLISDKFFTVGDVIRYNNIEGIVEDFNMRVTRIKNLSNGDYMTICNRNISEVSLVSNWSDIEIGLSYDDDPQKVHAVLGAIAKKVEDLPNVEACVYKGTARFDSSAIVYKIRIFCPPDKRFDARRSCISMLQTEIPKNGLNIPYDHINVLINSEIKDK